MLRKFLSVSAKCAAIGALALPLACEREPSLPGREDDSAPAVGLALDQVADLLSASRIGPEQVGEVYDAVSLSAANGYDEEYTMADLFAQPGCGVGGKVTRAPRTYASPLRDRIGEAVRERMATKADGGGLSAGDYLSALASSGLQIYWPYSENWDGETLPVVTFDPEDDIAANVGYELMADGSVEKVIVTEEMAMERPVWVVNRNSDAAFQTLSLPLGKGAFRPNGLTKASSGDIRTLVLRSFTAHRNFDSWFAGGSEFWVKVGAVDDFTASTEAELRLYQPTITDFLIVVRRKQVGKELPYDAVLVSEWTPQLTDIAFMVVEDDGGARTSWKCTATVKYNSKNYGFELELPLNKRDDIVWRGQLSRSFVEKYSGRPAHFGDVSIKLELI